MQLIKRLASVALIFALFGCAFTEAITVDSRKNINSYADGEMLFAYVLKPDDKSGVYTLKKNDDSSDPAKTKAMAPLAHILNACQEKREVEIAPVAGILLAAAVSWTASEISNEIGDYIDGVKKKYSPPSDTTTIDLNGLWSGPKLNFSCVVVGMAPEKVLKDRSGIDPSQLHFLFVAKFEPSSGIQPAAFRIVPLYYILAKSKAMATPAGDEGKSKVRVTVEYAISATSSKETSKVVDVLLALPVTPLPDCDSSAQSCLSNPVDLSNVEPSAWFSIPREDGKDTSGQPYCPAKSACMPANLTVTLTEIGNGSPDFDKAHSELTDDSKALADTINKIIDAKTSK
ncbi:hypothetical protein BLA39750_03516 [Burkholderia lata]|uniref:Lipoprotein n=1 Tax=Burkholderia lata (strain ATCC 17760 / DSM 23089 / LMG 22485 / NCIMB 9086 / R18194 / 383) TaxID=482957 RepID=A0A6P2Y0G7_BURL3|nr:hypothetical protein [Burkholderia lata]VWD15383.1 hypothetical protein BLA39750_03516 [Burkholderia lata]